MCCIPGVYRTHDKHDSVHMLSHDVLRSFGPSISLVDSRLGGSPGRPIGAACHTLTTLESPPQFLHSRSARQLLLQRINLFSLSFFQVSYYPMPYEVWTCGQLVTLDILAMG